MIRRKIGATAMATALALVALAPAGEGAVDPPGNAQISISGTDVLISGDGGDNGIRVVRYNADGEAGYWGDLHILSSPGSLEFVGPTDTANYSVYPGAGRTIIYGKGSWRARNIRVSLTAGDDSFGTAAVPSNIFLSMGDGDDYVRGEYVDNFSVGSGDDRVIDVLIANRSGFTAGPGNDRLIKVMLDWDDKPVLGGPGNDTITAYDDYGNDQPDLFVGGPGNDRLFGYDDDDTLNGGAGRDLCDGGGNRRNAPDRAIGCEVERGIP